MSKSSQSLSDKTISDRISSVADARSVEKKAETPKKTAKKVRVDDNTFKPVECIFSPRTLKVMKEQYLMISQCVLARHVMGSDFTLDDDRKETEKIPQCDDYEVFEFIKKPNGNIYRLFKCNYKSPQPCDRYVSNLSKFFDHLRSHTGEKPFLCEVEGCNKSFTQRTNLKQHILEVHDGYKPFSCEICGKGFAKKFNAQTHLQSCLRK